MTQHNNNLLQKLIDDNIINNQIMEKYESSKLSQQQWELRKMQFSNFANYPFYSVSFPIDLTKFKAYTHQNSIGTYPAMVYIIVKTANEIQQFRYRIRNGDIVCYTQIDPSITVLLPTKKLEFARLSLNQKFQDFAKECESVKNGGQPVENGEDVIYTTCLPWIPFTALANANIGNPDDCIPRIAWGKIVSEEKSTKVTFSIQVNHRTVDGYHLGSFYEKLQSHFDNSEKILK